MLKNSFSSQAHSAVVRDDLTGDVVVVAPKRAHRPSHIRRIDPFSPAHLIMEHVIAAYGRGLHRMTVIENKFPVFDDVHGVRGHQEILVEGKKTQIENVLRAYAARAAALRKMKLIKGLVVFKNEGSTAGASQTHAHSQIFGLSFIPDRWKEIHRRRCIAERRHGMTSHALAITEASSARTIYADRHVTAFAHPAARFPYEVRILTRRKIDNITQATPAEITSLAKALHVCLGFVRKRKFTYNFFFHDVFADTHEHFEIRFVPRTTIWGGFELDTGIAVNPITAEHAAEEYRTAFGKGTSEKR
ncbi:MAG: hypothetical protein AAB879_01715 [Patescibacteria group bacterium]